MKRILNKPIFALLALLLVFSGCRGVGYLPFGTSFAMKCDPRYKAGVQRPLFHEAKIASDPEKAVIVLYRPFEKVCGTNEGEREWNRERDIRRKVIFSIGDKEVVHNLTNDHFTVLHVNPRKIRFSVKRKSWPFDHNVGELEISLEAGETYFFRWSGLLDYIYSKDGNTKLGYFQLIDVKTAQRELNGVMYLAPQAFKAPVFDKKTGKPL